MTLDIDYTVKRSAKRKRLTITVERDRSIVVHAPEATTDDRIRSVLQSKRAWLREKIDHPRKYAVREHPPGKEVVNGESALYLGRNYRIELVDSRDREIRFEQKFLIPKWLGNDRRTVLRGWYRSQAEKTIPPRVEAAANRLGVRYGKLTFADDLYRWGSCSPRGNLRLNWRLIKAPTHVIDYVIVHELAHLIEPDHGERFWNIVRTQLPKATQAMRWLREHGQILEGPI